MQRESATRLIRFAHLLARRIATGLAVVAALAFVLDGALAGNHHLGGHLGAQPAGAGHHHAHAHVHSHGDAHKHAHDHASVHASDHQLATGDVAGGVDVAGAHHGFSPVSGADPGATCCSSCTCCAVMVLPCLNAQAVPFVLLRTVATTLPRHGDGVVPDGQQRPPRPFGIA